jgi:hypothetical protein
VRLSHALARARASFDDPNLVSHAGPVPVMALAGRAGLPELVAEHVRPGGGCGLNAHLKVPCLVAGMAAGADRIDDMGMLRHGATETLFGGIRAPSTLGSHLRSLPGETLRSWREQAGSSLRNWPGRRRCCPARTCSRSSTSTRCRKGLRPREAGRGVRPHEDPGQVGAGPGPERARCRDQHAAGGTGNRRDPAAGRERGLRPRRRGPGRPGRCGPRRAGRVVPRLAPPRRLHRLPLRDSRGRKAALRRAVVEQVFADVTSGPLAGRPRRRPDQPRPGPQPRARQGHPNPNQRTSRRKRQRRETRAPITTAEQNRSNNHPR